MNGAIDIEKFESRIALLEETFEKVQRESIVSGHGQIVNHGKRFDIDASGRLTDILNHLHDGHTLKLDAINSDGGAFPFNTTGPVKFNQNLIMKDITFPGDTTENLIKFPDNLAVALDFTEASNSYMKFITTNGREKTVFGYNVHINRSFDGDVRFHVDNQNAGPSAVGTFAIQAKDTNMLIYCYGSGHATRAYETWLGPATGTAESQLVIFKQTSELLRFAASLATWAIPFNGITGSKIGTLTFADGSITDSGGSISFGNENLSTAGTFVMSANVATFTHSGTTSLTIVSTSGTVIIESVTFTGANVTGIGTLTADSLICNGDIIIGKTSGLGIKVDTSAPTFGWRDLEGFEIPDPTGGDRPTLSTYSGGLIKENAFSNGDTLRMRYHIPHDYVKGTDILSHIHWSHNGTAISGNVVFGITSNYAKGHNQANFGTEKSISITYNTTDISTTPQRRHRIEESLITSDGGSATLIDRGLLEPDGIILVTFEVTTNPTITGGSPNNVFVHRADLHYQSTNIATKQKVPDFYT